jgi:hypothetical protein
VNGELIYVCNACAHTWQDRDEGVQRCEACRVPNVDENIYTFEVYASEYAAEWSQKVLEAVAR